MCILLSIIKAFAGNNDKEKEMDKYDLSEEEKRDVRKGYYEPDEFDYDDDDDDHDY